MAEFINVRSKEGGNDMLVNVANILYVKRTVSSIGVPEEEVTIVFTNGDTIKVRHTFKGIEQDISNLHA